MAEEWMKTRERFRSFKRGGAGGDAVRSERGLRGAGNRLLCQRMRQRFECGIVVERQVRSFIAFDEHQDARRGVRLRPGIEREPMRRGESPGMAMPVAERGDVVGFSGHLQPAFEVKCGN